jgi:hypothetical protein
MLDVAGAAGYGILEGSVGQNPKIVNIPTPRLQRRIMFNLITVLQLHI